MQPAPIDYEDATRRYRALRQSEESAVNGYVGRILSSMPIHGSSSDWSACLQAWNKAVLGLGEPPDEQSRLALELAKCSTLGIAAEACGEHSQAVLRFTEALRWQEALYGLRGFPHTLIWCHGMALQLNMWAINLAACSSEGNPDYQEPLNRALTSLGAEHPAEHPTLHWFRRKEWDLFDSMDCFIALLLTPEGARKHGAAHFRFFVDMLTTHAVYAGLAGLPPAEQASPDADNLITGHVREWNYVVNRQRVFLEQILPGLSGLEWDWGGADRDDAAGLTVAARSYMRAAEALYAAVTAPKTHKEDLAPIIGELHQAARVMSEAGEPG